MPDQDRKVQKGGVVRRKALRPDTTLAPAGKPEEEIYVGSLPVCCLRSLKLAALAEPENRRSLTLDCSSCGRSWWITSSLDERLLKRFVTHGGPRVTGGTYPAA